MDLTRRELGLAGAGLFASLAGGPLAAQGSTPIPTRFNGVRMGNALYNFRTLPRLADPLAYLDSFIAACVAVGVGTVEINAPYLEPATHLPFAGIPRLWDQPLTGGLAEAFARLSPAEVSAEREALRRWRLETPPAHYAAIGDRFRAAGLAPFSYVMTFTPDMTEAEIAAILAGAAALGVRVFSTNQTKVEMAPRLLPHAVAHDMVIGWHNHAALGNPNEVAGRATLERLLAVHPRMMVNLDTGHYVAANEDVLAFAADHYDRITHFHMKDRKRDLGPGTPMGEGDVPLAALLHLIRERGGETPAIVEYEYSGAGTPVAEVRRSIAFMQDLLARPAA